MTHRQNASDRPKDAKRPKKKEDQENKERLRDREHTISGNQHVS